jgi:5-methylcytosine-specific restriction endonuclease McrA
MVKVQEGKFKNGSVKYKNYWKCYKCEELFRDVKMMEMDHVKEVDSFNGDWNDFIKNRLYCDISNVRAICIPCHKEKTSAFNARKMFKRK